MRVRESAVSETVTIEERFCGPPNAGNGGYVCGVLAGIVGQPLEVTLRRATPLGRPLTVERAGDGATLRDGEAILADARRVDLRLDVPQPLSFEAAEEAAGRFPRFVDHPIPRCLVCGPEREAGDGLRIFPGPVNGGGLYAAPWVPDASVADRNGVVRPEIVCAALDCPGAFAMNEPPQGLALLGRLALELVKPIAVGERCVILAWPIAREGRKLFPGTAIFSESGDLRAVARATWVLLA
jgi:hypothetical protein